MNVERPYSPWVSYYAPDKAYNGYTLFTPSRGSVAWLIDMAGRPVHCWTMPYRPGPYGVLLPNGNLLYAGQDISGPHSTLEGGGGGGILLEVDWDGNLVWEYREPYQHHDFYRMDNGNTMVLGMIRVPDDIAAKVRGGVPGTEANGAMWADFFREITPAGETAWEWFAYEHLDPEVDIICPLDARDRYSRANSCFVMPNGDVLSHFNALQTIAIIDKSTGDIKWRWGATKEENLGHAHNPTLLENGNILVFDNGNHRRVTGLGFGGYSRVLEINPNTREIEWEYKANPPQSFYSNFVSGAQRLANGNTLICEGAHGRFFEVTPDQEVVWEFISPFYHLRADTGWTNQVFRAYRYSPDFEGLSERVLDPDRVELTLREKQFGKEETRQQRLGHLGY